MSISMQGTWTVSVKSRDAAFDQRFVIQGSTNGKDGIHSGAVGTSVIVTGPQWAVTVQNDKGAGTWTPSAERVGTPSSAGGQVSFDIHTDDGGGGADADYNDLVLTCSFTPSPSEFVIYGRVRSYSGTCLFNPCFPLPYVVIDTPALLDRALANSAARAAIEKLYPERVRLVEKAKKRFIKPIPQPDPPPFRPMMIPLADTEGASVLATQKARENTVATANTAAAKATVGAASLAGYSSSILEIAKAKDLLRPVCTVQNRPGLLLRFVEYDRTASELAGGAYTGEGNRKVLGMAVTDELGNYVFRFTRTDADVAAETGDVPAGVSLTAGLRPDILAQVVASIGPTPTVLYESGLFSDISTLKRIDLCVPASVLQPGTDNCLGTRAIQAIGNIFTLTGVGNTLDSAGRITATNSNGPQITRGAWGGSLHLFACFLGKPQVKTYTIRFRKPGGGWSFFQELYTHINKAAIGDMNSPLHKVGPFNVPLHVDGGPAITVPAYNNIEADPNWVETHRLRKAILSSGIYTAALYPGESAGSVDFRIDGYDAAGNKVTGADDTVRLYIDNRSMTGDIASVTLGATPPTECALFQLTSANDAITMRFKVNQPGGFLESYSVAVYRGSATPVPVVDSTAPVEPLSVTYSEGAFGNAFYGTANGVAPDGDGYVTVDLQPVSGAWLPAGKTFCAFSFEINGDLRITDGYHNFGGGRLDFELVGINL